MIPGENRPRILPANINNRTPLPGAGFGLGPDQQIASYKKEARNMGIGCGVISAAILGGVLFAAD